MYYSLIMESYCGFNLPPYKLLLTNIDTFTISLTVNDEVSGESYQIKQHKLSKISTATIEAALLKQNPSVKCIIEKGEDSLTIEFRVELEYLPKMSETLILSRTEKKVQAELQSTEIQAQIGEINQLINEMGRSKYKAARACTENFQHKPIFKDEVQKGSYILGVYMAANYYDELCEDNYEENQSKSFDIAVKTIVNHEVELKKTKLLINYRDGYDYPFNMNRLITLRDKGTVEVTIQSNFMFNISDSQITLEPVIVSKGK